MSYEWIFLNQRVPDTWHKDRTSESAFRAAMRVARKLYPKAASKGYARRIITDDGSQKIDFGHYTVFIAIRKVKNEKHR